MPTNIIDSIQLSGVTYTLQGSGGGGGGTVESAITSGSTNAVESKAIYDATHIDSIDLWTATDSNNYNNNTQSLYKVYVQYTGDTALDEQVQVEIYYGSNFTREAITGNVYQETASTSSVFTSTFDNGKWIIESSSPNYIRSVYADYRFKIWVFIRAISDNFAADSIKDDIIPYINDVDTIARNAVTGGNLMRGDSNKELRLLLQQGNGGSTSSVTKLDDLKCSNNGTLSTDIQIPTGEIGWTEITPQNNCTAGNMPTNKVKVTYSGQTVSTSYRGLQFDAVFATNVNTDYYRVNINWSNTTTPTVNGCSAVTATYDSTDDSVTIELPTGETTYNGSTGTFSISNFRSNTCQFGTGISSVKYYGDITEDIYAAIAHKQNTLSAGTGIEISGNVISATGGGGGNPTVELTQAEYDALVSAGTVSANTYYIITDATPVDISNYWTSAQTQSAITEATSGKVDTSAITSSVTSASTDSEIPTAKAVFDAIPQGGGGSVTIDPSLDSGSTNPVENRVIYNKIDEVEQVTARALNDLNEKKQDTLSAGTGISISGNVISATGGGGGGTVDSAITSGSTNAVQSSAIWSATTYNKDVTIEFDSTIYNYSTNFPSGCTTVKVEASDMSLSVIRFYSDDSFIGQYTIDFMIKNVTNSFTDSTYEISGNTVIITYPSSKNVNRLAKTNTYGNQTVKAVVEGAWVNENTYMKSEVDGKVSTLQNNINAKLDSTAYTPTVVDSTLTKDSTNPVQNQALYDELRIVTGKEPDTVITWSSNRSTNFPSGCTKIEVDTTNLPQYSDTIIQFYKSNGILGTCRISKFISISVFNTFTDSTYSISGSVVTIEWPSSKGVVGLEYSGTESPVTAIGSDTIISVKQAIPTTTSAITSGSTDVITSGAVYAKLDEMEQVIARALNDLNARITAIENQLNSNNS